jgi:N-acetylmuramoyl-L-alanine amidase
MADRQKKTIPGYTVKDHLLHKDGNPVSWKRSPNIGGLISPRLIVIHYTGDNGTAGLEWLTTKGSGVSSHLWIGQSGIVWQLAKFNVRCWHAGASYYQDPEDGWETRDVNTWSIGIENQGLGDKWPDKQIQANKGVIRALYRAYGIQDTVGHEDVATPYGRKSDPGPLYPWDKVFAR